MENFRSRKVIVGTVAEPPFTNYGNLLIERATFDLLGLPLETPKFSVFRPITDELLEVINAHDYVVITGCTTLQDSPGHQRCFDAMFEKIRPRRVCLAGAFYCEPGERPSLRIARLYDTPIAARDPWTADYLSDNGFECAFVGCPTLISVSGPKTWRSNDGPVVISSSPPLAVDVDSLVDGRPVRYVAHEQGDRGVQIAGSVFDDAAQAITGRLHAALPAIARGVPAHFYGPRYWQSPYADYKWGSTRYTLLDYLGLRDDGTGPVEYPVATIQGLKDAYARWRERVFG